MCWCASILGMGIASAFLQSLPALCGEMGDGGPEAFIGARARGRRRGRPVAAGRATGDRRAIGGVRPYGGTLGDHAGIRLATSTTRWEQLSGGQPESWWYRIEVRAPADQTAL